MYPREATRQAVTDGSASCHRIKCGVQVGEGNIFHCSANLMSTLVMEQVVTMWQTLNVIWWRMSFIVTPPFNSVTNDWLLGLLSRYNLPYTYQTDVLQSTWWLFDACYRFPWSSLIYQLSWWANNWHLKTILCRVVKWQHVSHPRGKFKWPTTPRVGAKFKCFRTPFFDCQFQVRRQKATTLIWIPRDFSNRNSQAREPFSCSSIQ